MPCGTKDTYASSGVILHSHHEQAVAGIAGPHHHVETKLSSPVLEKSEPRTGPLKDRTWDRSRTGPQKCYSQGSKSTLCSTQTTGYITFRF
jgi:hypothetical protein